MKDKIFAIPNWALGKVIIMWTLLSTLFFTIIYGLCNHYASLSSTHYKMYTDWELKIPLIPWMIYPYLSLNLLFLVSAFVLKEVKAVKGFCLSLIVGVIVGGIIFYFFPGHLGFVRETVPGYEKYFDVMFAIDKPHNLYPSLHVTYSSLAIGAMIQQTNSKWFHYLLYIWLILICSSVVFVHQHHLFDIVSGALLAAVLFKCIYLKQISK